MKAVNKLPNVVGASEVAIIEDPDKKKRPLGVFVMKGITGAQDMHQKIFQPEAAEKSPEAAEKSIETLGGWRGVIKTFLGIAKGLKAIHKKGIIHRDLKPSNIIISDKGKVYIADFGVSAWEEETTKDDKKSKKEGRGEKQERALKEQAGPGVVVAPVMPWTLCWFARKKKEQASTKTKKRPPHREFDYNAGETIEENRSRR